jgi:hypothetical protein
VLVLFSRFSRPATPTPAKKDAKKDDKPAKTK